MFRKNLMWLVIGLVVAALLAGCKKQLSPYEPAPTQAPSSQIYYTQFSLFQEKNTYRTTNYRKGILIPINTEVTLQAMRGDEADLRLVDGGQILTIENVPKHTLDDMQTAFNKIVGPSKVDMKAFSQTERDAIMAGRVVKGMSRKAVLAAIGYPPKHETPSLEANDWVYWSNRFNRFVVHFKNDKVESVVE
ncbi:MAG: hypothetical protein PHH11_03775 [Methylomonas sp.]|nr:hypothetical protein [Methylomonas sp.]